MCADAFNRERERTGSEVLPPHHPTDVAGGEGCGRPQRDADLSACRTRVLRLRDSGVPRQGESLTSNDWPSRRHTVVVDHTTARKPRMPDWRRPWLPGGVALFSLSRTASHTRFWRSLHGHSATNASHQRTAVWPAAGVLSLGACPTNLAPTARGRSSGVQRALTGSGSDRREMRAERIGLGRGAAAVA